MNTNRLFLILLFSVIIIACSQLSELIVQEPSEETASIVPMTKAGEQQPQRLNYYKALHYAQSNHITMIIKHVAFRDSVYVQTLTDEDYRTLDISQEEINFGNYYVATLNSLLYDAR